MKRHVLPLVLLALAVLLASASCSRATPTPEVATAEPSPVAEEAATATATAKPPPTPTPEDTPTPEPTATPAAALLAPDGVPKETYYAPFPLPITLDGDLSDWEGVPHVTVPEGIDLSSGRPAVTFAAAADDTYLYFVGDVIDTNIISGEHSDSYWNEDSLNPISPVPLT